VNYQSCHCQLLIGYDVDSRVHSTVYTKRLDNTDYFGQSTYPMNLRDMFDTQ
jgi:hypothetical protein